MGAPAREGFRVKIVVLASGRLREKYTRLGTELYAKRLSSMVPFEIVEVSEGKGAGAEETGERLLSRLREGDRVVLLAEDGEQYGSEKLATFLNTVQKDGRGRIVFVIGGPYGVGEGLRRRAEFVLSLGKMTLPHELARVVLVEQLYRATTITRGGSYHHGSPS